MTTKELIAKLQTFDPNAEVLVKDQYGYAIETYNDLKYQNVDKGVILDEGVEGGEKVVVIGLIS